MREMWFACVVLLSLAAASPGHAQAPAAPANPTPPLTLTDDDRILGSKDAPITIVEYASLTCPHCRHFDTEVLPKLKTKWIDTGKVRLILRDFPLDAVALRAAMLTRCAAPDQYYPFVDALFAGQEQWATAPDPNVGMEKVALLAGMNNKQASECLADKAIETKIVQSRLTASQQLSVDATPTFFVNGTKFSGAPTEEAFDELLTKLSAKS